MKGVLLKGKHFGTTGVSFPRVGRAESTNESRKDRARNITRTYERHWKCPRALAWASQVDLPSHGLPIPSQVQGAVLLTSPAPAAWPHSFLSLPDCLSRRARDAAPPALTISAPSAEPRTKVDRRAGAREQDAMALVKQAMIAVTAAVIFALVYGEFSPEGGRAPAFSGSVIGMQTYIHCILLELSVTV